MLTHKPNKLNCKWLLGLVLTAIIAFSVFTITCHSIEAQPTPVISVVLSGTTNNYSITTQSVGSQFTVDVRIDDYANVNLGGSNNGVSGCSYAVTWDPAVLEFVSNNDPGWLPSELDTDVATNVTSGLLIVNQIAFGSSTQVVASNTAGSVSEQITFQVVSSGSSAISLERSALGVGYLIAPTSTGVAARSGYVPNVTTVNATYGSSALSVYGPTAAFTPSDGAIFKVGSPISLNADLSQPGYDGKTCNITSCVWSVEYPNGTTFVSLTGETASFTASALGSFRIILIVTADDTQNPPDPSYNSTASSSADINVVPSLQSPEINVFTDQGGLVAGTNGGSYGPLQAVQAFASVTLGGLPLSGELVLFDIVDANGTAFLRTGITNETGIATIQPGFRLPNPIFGTNQTGFGTWSITASASVGGAAIKDTVAFNFGYINSFEKIDFPESISRGVSVPIQLTVENQLLSSMSSKLCITLFDQADIPIDSSTLTLTQSVQNITVVDTSITIPAWAFAGQANANFCLLTN